MLAEYIPSVQSQMNQLIHRGYHSELGIDSTDYVRSLYQIAAESHQPTSRDGVDDRELFPVIVDPRITFKRQLDLSGIDLDPAVYTYPVHHPTWPYVAYVRIFPMTKDQPTLRHVVEGLDPAFRLSTPVEGIAVADALLERKFLVLAGGDFSSGSIVHPAQEVRDYYCLDRYRGRKRFTYVDPKSSDSMIGVLATMTSF